MSLALECSAVAGVLGSITYFLGVSAVAGAVLVSSGDSDSRRFARAFCEHFPARRVGVVVEGAGCAILGGSVPELNNSLATHSISGLAVTVLPLGVAGFGT